MTRPREMPHAVRDALDALASSTGPVDHGAGLAPLRTEI